MTAGTVALVDDHALIVHALSNSLINAGFDCHPVAPAPADTLLAALHELQPRTVLLDLDLGEYGDTIPLIAPLAESGIRVVILTAVDDAVRLGQAVASGAVAIVRKGADFTELVETITHVAHSKGITADRNAERYLAAYYDDTKQSARMRAPFEQLTEREGQVLAALAKGDTVHQIAMEWVVSETTIRSHVRAILHKLGARSQLQAVVRAVQSGWLSPGAE